MSLLNRSPRALLGTAVFFFVTSASALAGLIDVTPTITANGALTHYAYTIANNTADDPFVIDIPVAKGLGVVLNLTAPVGFTKAYESVLGLVSFLEDTAFFTSTPKGGFSFDSAIKPQAVQFQATVLGGVGIYNLSGPTMSAQVPEPGYLPAFLSLLVAAPLLRRRIRR